MARILLAEDDLYLSQSIASGLSALNYSIDVAHDGLAAEAFVRAHEFDLLILDWNLPGQSGVEVCKTLRRLGRHEPVLFLTSRAEIEAKVEALTSGADDYLTKPFDIRELIARVASLLRRPPAYVTHLSRIGAVTLDLGSHTLQRGEDSVKLRRREMELLEFFVRRPGQVLGPNTILSGVWGADFEGSEIALRSCITRLRKALQQLGYGDVIQNVHGFGYILKLPVED